MYSIKQKIVFVCIMLSGYLSYSQLIVPLHLSNSAQYDVDFLEKNKAYLKDVDGKLNKYEGVWEGSFLGLDYIFKIEKYIEDDLYDFKEDILAIRYVVKNSNTKKVLENTLLLPIDHKLVIFGSKYEDDNLYVLDYFGRYSDCGQIGEIYLRPVPASTDKIKLKLIPDRTNFIFEETCPSEEIDLELIPTKYITLTKR